MWCLERHAFIMWAFYGYCECGLLITGLLSVNRLIKWETTWDGNVWFWLYESTSSKGVVFVELNFWIFSTWFKASVVLDIEDLIF